MRYIVVAYDFVRDAKVTNDMLFDGVGYGTPIAFLSGIASGHLMNYLVVVKT